ncbi:MAG: hypothetical protein LBN34_08950 [Clostridiales Family XIII bacterium]|jgi:hypothetical protein|nr:hypothetical protein [Clostridiales Family XIII bacterium]
MIDWRRSPKNTREVWEYLKNEAVKKMRVVTYSEVAEYVGDKVGHEIAPISIAQPLGFIRDEICKKHNLPLINVLVVNKNTSFPGESFLPNEIEADCYFRKRIWRLTVVEVFLYPWETFVVND